MAITEKYFAQFYSSKGFPLGEQVECSSRQHALNVATKTMGTLLPYQDPYDGDQSRYRVAQVIVTDPHNHREVFTAQELKETT